MVPLHYGLSQVTKIKSAMNKSTRLMITAAAVAGLYAGSSATSAYAAGVAGSSKSMLKDGAGTHSCKGQNDCKGQGGCKSSDNGCKGQNSCKGKGGCNTASSDQTPTPTPSKSI
jgi:hypothetical protein